MIAAPGTLGSVTVPLVSVSLLTYNHEAWIGQAIESVVSQRTSFPVELIIGEDCSGDGTRTIVQKFAERYPDRIRTVLPSSNLGGGGVPLLLRTLNAARGTFIARLDGDDYWTSDEKLEAQVQYLRDHPACTACFHNVLRVTDDEGSDAQIYNVPGQPPFLELDDLFERCVIAGCSPLIRREAILPLPDWYGELPFGDWPLYMLAAQRGSIGYMEELMGTYRVHSRGVWSGADLLAQAEAVVRFLQVVLPRLGVERLPRAREALGYRQFRLAEIRSHRGDLRGARVAARRALKPGRHLARVSVPRLVLMLIRPELSRVRRLVTSRSDRDVGPSGWQS
jgi:glycosyltransferase involved in cell wall biosynthesis